MRTSIFIWGEVNSAAIFSGSDSLNATRKCIGTNYHLLEGSKKYTYKLPFKLKTLPTNDGIENFLDIYINCFNKILSSLITS